MFGYDVSGIMYFVHLKKTYPKGISSLFDAGSLVGEIRAW